MKVISIKVPDEFHRQMKLIAIKQGKSIKEYVMELIEKTFKRKRVNTHRPKFVFTQQLEIGALHSISKCIVAYFREKVKF